MKAAQIREKFLQFFEQKGHTIVPSAPMVIKDDPTLMFTNAGMNPFKEYFLGNALPKSRRVADTQKCLRVSGKHNDLEEVGIDTYHHTFFEMLGNWSFGDYFKKEAIQWAWELLTEVYGIDPDTLYVTIFEGAEEEGISRDHEAYAFWKAMIPEERILLGNKKDNFWEMGDQGPCGPCSEIHVDIRSEEEKAQKPGAYLVNKDHPQVIEVWNLVFIEFNRKANGSLEKLPEKHIDTGMGFERLCMVLQNKKSNYDTDVFMPLIEEIERLTQSVYGKNEATDRAIRVIADHLRTVYFAIADGQLPSNTGAGYVIRRILRRAIRYGFTFLNQKEPFIHQLVAVLEAQMGSVFKELTKEQNLAFNVIREEENSFLKTLDQGLQLLDTIIEKTVNKKIEGAKAFELYDTFGFPLDLTALIAKERGFETDVAGFEDEMAKQKARSRAAAATATEDWVLVRPNENELFVGYDKLETSTFITRYRKIESAKEGSFYQFVLSKTPFYPEGGGQVGDQGHIVSAEGTVYEITDTKKENNLILHYAKSLPQSVETPFQAVVHPEKRMRTAANHTATHLMHQALRKVLGDHVAQKGSMVQDTMFRFDFSHFAKVTPAELQQVELFVNERIGEKIPLEENRAVPFQEAVDSGAIALFGEKYGDTVRTIRFGDSIELCGGTHVQNTDALWYFKIVSESAVASGIRRIEAITANAAKQFFEKQTADLENVKTVLKNPQDPLKIIQSLQEENALLKKELVELGKLKTKMIKKELIDGMEIFDGYRFLAREVGLDAKGMKELSFELGNEYKDLVLVLASKKTGKPLICCYVSKPLVETKKLNAVQIIKKLGSHIQGGGGGQPFFATAGGKNIEGIPAAVAAAQDALN